MSVGEALAAQFLLRQLRLLYAIQAHASQDTGRFRELDVAVIDDLDVVAPRIVEVKRSRWLNSNPGLQHRPSDRFHVVNDEAKVPRTVGRLRAAARQRDELITDINESHPPASATTELEIEEPPVPVQRLIEIADLQRHMVDTDEPRHVPSW